MSARYIPVLFSVIIFIVLCSNPAYSDNAGGRGVYTHGGWVGARYIASGMSGEVMADDVFSIYWNPAGLAELETKSSLTEQQIQKDANEGKLDNITEEDLLNFSEDSSGKNFFALGFSATRLDIERDALFSGIAFNAFGGVLGVGAFSIMSTGIETRDESGNLTGHTDYSGSAGYLSYAYAGDIFSIGFTVKGLYESIGESSYAGAGADIGIQVFLLPFLKAGIMARDLGSFLRPYDAPDSEDRYDFVFPQIKTGILFISDSGVRFSLSGGRKLEQSDYGYGIGIEYRLNRFISVDSGVDNGYFTAGFTLNLGGFDVSYAVSFDRVDYGYNNTVSAGFLF